MGLGSVNKVILLGNVGKDPDIRRTQDGRPIVNLSIATSESWRDKVTGERKEKTEWHRVVIFSEGLAKVAEQYVRKGSKLYIEGQLQTRKYTDNSGVEKYSTEVVLHGFSAVLTMLDNRQEEQRPSIGQQPRSRGNDPAEGYRGDPISTGRTEARQNAYAEATGRSLRRSDMDDEIPFGPEFR